jgi:hypothetical protein
MTGAGPQIRSLFDLDHRKDRLSPQVHLLQPFVFFFPIAACPEVLPNKVPSLFSVQPRQMNRTLAFVNPTTWRFGPRRPARRAPADCNRAISASTADRISEQFMTEFISMAARTRQCRSTGQFDRVDEFSVLKSDCSKPSSPMRADLSGWRLIQVGHLQVTY